jgi:beta-mannosidase
MEHDIKLSRTQKRNSHSTKNLIVYSCLAVLFAIQYTFSSDTNRMMKIEIRDHWKFKQENTEKWYSAEVPGCVHTDLMKNTLIPDPFVGTNEQSLQWIGEKNWIYETTFDVPAEILNKESVELVFDGLDTYAAVTLNDSLILNANNMFRTWRIDCRKILLEHGNHIVVRFKNVFDETLPKYKAAPFELQAFPNNDQADVKIAMYSRKAQFHYGWDWGPRLITCGIWRPMYVEGWSKFKIQDVHIQQKNVSSIGADIVSIINIHSAKVQTVSASLDLDSLNVVTKVLNLKPGINKVQLNSHLANPQLWWTNGLGSQKLYNYQLAVTDDSGSRDVYSIKIGIRSIEVVREKDSQGTSMMVRLNGIPVFMKGANYIPQDNFQNRVTKERCEHIVRSAAEANMNMLRVWGGGIYEDDQFYDLCDRYGILLWQEIMFACAMYPGDDEFIENVRREVIDNIIRLRNHACVALYCGNNENEVAWEQWGWKEKNNKKAQRVFEQNAEKLFYNVIPSAIREADSTRYYHPTSPSAGYKKISANDGDIHYWGVWHGKELFETYTTTLARFISEYGFQSYPELSTIAQYAKPEDRTLHSEIMLSHQRCMADERRDKEYGNRLIQWYMDRWYRTPKDFASYVYVSQVLQAEGVKIAMEAHRRAMPFCMGSLYWQIDDCWPVASWSSIDYYGRWKALQYTAQHSYAPILVSSVFSKDDMKVYLVSDKREKIDALLDATVMDFDGKVVFQKSIPVFVKPNQAEIAAVFSMSQLVSNLDKSRLVFVCSLKKGDTLLAEDISYFTTPKDLDLKQPKYSKNITKTDSGFSIELSANTLAKNVYLICSDNTGLFNDNYFDIIPGIPRTIKIRTQLQQKEFEQSLKIISLADSYSK